MEGWRSITIVLLIVVNFYLLKGVDIDSYSLADVDVKVCQKFPGLILGLKCETFISSPSRTIFYKDRCLLMLEVSEMFALETSGSITVWRSKTTNFVFYSSNFKTIWQSSSVLSKQHRQLPSWKSGLTFTTINTVLLSCRDEDGSSKMSTAAPNRRLLPQFPNTKVSNNSRKKSISILAESSSSFCRGELDYCGEYGICSDSGDCVCVANLSSFSNASDPRKGCKLDRPPVECDKTELVELPRMITVGFTNYIYGVTLDFCKDSCMTNCSCKGLIYSSDTCLHLERVPTLGNSTSSGSGFVSSFVKVGQELHRNDSDGAGKYDQNHHLTRRRNVRIRPATAYIIAAIVLGSLIAMVLAVWIFCCKVFVLMPIKNNAKERNFPILPEFRRPPVYFSYRELCEITENFGRKLGRGGFSTVFRGALRDGSKVAVKQLEGTRSGLKQFGAEVKTIGSIHHRNLVRLQGYGAAEHYYYLVYDLLDNLSLDKWLFYDRARDDREHQQQQQVLSWKTRCQIAVDVARGLDYLHGGCKDQVLHLDIKPQNILLDSTFEAKISDFGLAKLVDRTCGDKESKFVNTVPRGTPGYMAPEWLHSGVTDRTDVYSFGIVLLELVSGKKTVLLPSSFAMSHGSSSELLTVKGFESDLLLQSVDPRLLLLPDFDMEEARKVVKVGLLCVSKEQSQRPSMGNVLKMLEDVVLKCPKQFLS